MPSPQLVKKKKRRITTSPHDWFSHTRCEVILLRKQFFFVEKIKRKKFAEFHILCLSCHWCNDICVTESFTPTGFRLFNHSHVILWIIGLIVPLMLSYLIVTKKKKESNLNTLSRLTYQYQSMFISLCLTWNLIDRQEAMNNKSHTFFFF